MIIRDNGVDRDATQAEIDELTALAALLSAPKPVTEEDYKAAIVALMDTQARSRRYDSALSLSTYVGSTNPTWSAEATAFVEWRDSVWAYCYAQLGLVAIMRRAQPTVAEFLTELPAMVWPL